MVLVWVAVGVTAIGALIAAGWGFHRLCIRLEDRGYIYYRTRSQGGGALSGALLDMERMIRPSVQHVVEVQDVQTRKSDDGVDGG